jgi:hypothetical protein
MDNFCEKRAFLCDKDDCECSKDHDGCLMLKIKSIMKKLCLKVVSLKPLEEIISNKID